MLLNQSSRRPASLDELADGRLLAKLDRLDVRTRRMFPGKLPGERRSKKRGQSVEFDDFRQYVPGDDLRFIDWNVYARFDRLFVKLFLEDEDLALHLVLDASPSMDAGSPPSANKLLFAARLAMALGYVGLTKQNRVGVSIFGAPGQRGLARLPDLRGRHNVQRLGRFLMENAWPERTWAGSDASPDGARPAEFNEALTTIARLRVGKGVMVLLSDFLIPGGYEPGLRALAAAGGYDTYCVQVLSPGEIDPERESEAGFAGDLRLTDAETGRAAEVTITPALIRKYKERLAHYCADLAAFCASRGMTHILARSDANVEAMILETFRRKGMVG